MARRTMTMTIAGLAAVVVLVAATPGTALAAPLRDADAPDGIAGGRQVVEADAQARAATGMVADTEAALTAALAAQTAARAQEQQVLTSPLPPAVAPTGTAVDAATRAILSDLLPEGAGANRARADALVVALTARLDDARSKLVAASTDRVRALADIEAAGLHRTRWSIALLDLLGAPVTTENLRGLDAWIAAESNNSTLLNPLATTMAAPGARNANEVGVKGYPSDAVGLDATVRTLRNGAYGPILAALATGDSALRLARAVAASPWGTGENVVRRLGS